MTDLVAATVARLSGPPITAPFRMVAGLLSLIAITTPPIDKMPAAFVLPPDEAYSSQNGLLNAVRQEGIESVRLLLLIGTATPQGAAVVNPVKPARDAVVAKLLGWQPDMTDGVMLIRSAKLIDFAVNFVTYEMVFARQHLERA